MDIVSLKEKLLFSSGFFGFNLIFAFLTSYLVVYYTDVALLPLGVIGTLLVVARIWDGLNDPLIGYLADRTRSRWGRFRPYLLFGSIPYAIIFVLVFSVPNFSLTSKIIYAIVTYILVGIARGFVDIPLWSLTSVISKDPEEKTRIISLANLFAFLGLFVLGVFGILLLEALGGTKSQEAYTIVAIIIGVISTSFLFLTFFSTKERIIPEKKSVPFVDNFKVIFRNKPLILVTMSVIISYSLVALLLSTQVFFARENLGNPELASLLALATFLPLLIGTIFSPWVIDRLGKKKTFIYALLLYSLILFTFNIVGYTNLTVVFIFTALSGFLYAFPMVLQVVMITDSVIYSEWKNGIRSDGVAMATNGLVAKLASSIAGGLVTVILAVYGYDALLTVQSEQTLTGIFNTVSLFPALAGLISVIPMLFYDLSEGKLEKMSQELASRNSE